MSRTRDRNCASPAFSATAAAAVGSCLARMFIKGNCRRQLRELKPQAREFREKCGFSAGAEERSCGPAPDAAVLEEKAREVAVGVLSPPGEHRLGIAEDTSGVVDLCPPRRVDGEVVASPRAVAELDVGSIVEATHGEIVPLEVPVPRPVEGATGKPQVAPVEFPARGCAPPWRATPFEERR